MRGFYVRILLSALAGGFVFALGAANFGDAGVLIGAVFGFAAGYLAFEYLTRRSEAELTREKYKDYE